MATEKINGVEIDTDKAQRLLQKLVISEKTNIKSSQPSACHSVP